MVCHTQGLILANISPRPLALSSDFLRRSVHTARHFSRTHCVYRITAPGPCMCVRVCTQSRTPDWQTVLLPSLFGTEPMSRTIYTTVDGNGNLLQLFWNVRTIQLLAINPSPIGNKAEKKIFSRTQSMSRYETNWKPHVNRFFWKRKASAVQFFLFDCNLQPSRFEACPFSAFVWQHANHRKIQKTTTFCCV